jgi:hypothetical protein
MSTLSKSLLAAGALAVGVSAPGRAGADAIPFAKLPVVTIPPATTAPAPVPAVIPATEHVDGLFPALQPDKVRKPLEDKNGYHYVSVFTDEKEAQAYSTQGASFERTDVITGPRTCLRQGDSLTSRITRAIRTKPYVAPPPSARMIAILKAQHRWPPPPVKPPKPGPPQDMIGRLQLEKLTVTGDTATVETDDVFLDFKTLGSRLITSQSVTLARVATGPSGAGIFASRDDKGQVQFLITNPALPPPAVDTDRAREVAQLGDVADRLMAQLPSGETTESGCGHVTFSLGAKPGAGEMATIISVAFLPPSSDPDDADAPGQELDPDQVDGMSDEARQQLAAQMAAQAPHSQRARPVAVNVSLSQLASEQAPLLSLSFGWAGKDQRLSF